jgi:hypothetical protein
MPEDNITFDRNEIFEYIRSRRRGKVVKVGVILGLNDNGVIKVGWSKCNLKDDRFVSHNGLKIARERIDGKVGADSIPVTPLCIRRQLRAFGGRSIRYFKGANKLEFIEHSDK